MINYLSVIYYLICILKANVPDFASANALNVAGPLLFRDSLYLRDRATSHEHSRIQE